MSSSVAPHIVSGSALQGSTTSYECPTPTRVSRKPPHLSNHIEVVEEEVEGEKAKIESALRFGAEHSGCPPAGFERPAFSAAPGLFPDDSMLRQQYCRQTFLQNRSWP